MAWSSKQVVLAHLVQHSLHWQRPQYQLVLRNVAGIRPVAGGIISSKNPSADNAGFARFMAYAESCGFVDSKNGPGYWSEQARAQCSRIHHRIHELAAEGGRLGLIGADGLAGFVERMTKEREGGPTRELAECDLVGSIRILEGLKAWLFALARQRGVQMHFAER